MKQDQFLDVIDRDEAERRFHAALDLTPLEAEEVRVEEALHRVLAQDVHAQVDVPSFDRANVDGFALHADDTFGASEEVPSLLKLNTEVVSCGATPTQTVAKKTATAVATGAMAPRAADSVVMIEHTDIEGDFLVVRKPVTPGANLSFAGTDIGRGETVLRRGDHLTSRETGVLAALGMETISVIRQPRVAIISIGDELIAAGARMRPGLVYDSNAAILADAVRELGGLPVSLGIVPDDQAALKAVLAKASDCDAILLSGGTSKGPGDLSYRVVSEFGKPGIIVHGVALKPGKPLCLAAIYRDRVQTDGKVAQGRPIPIAILPGFPTSAIFTFREFMAPVIRKLGGRSADPSTIVSARLPMRVNSERGRTEYLLVNLVHDPGAESDLPRGRGAKVTAYPMGKGSGSVTTFSRADGFIVIPRQREYLEAGDCVDVYLLSSGMRPADLVVIGSHCTGLDYLLGRLQEKGLHSKFLAVGSTGGLAAARRGECDLAGIHLLDPLTRLYNSPYVTEGLKLVRGYGRLQGIVYRVDDPRFAGCTSSQEAIERALADAECIIVNRNRGSGTRILIDGFLRDARPPGYFSEVRSHNAVVAAVAQRRADWGVAIAPVAQQASLGFLPLQEEQYDFVVPQSRWDRPALQEFRSMLAQASTRKALMKLGLLP
ncbi:MAG: molybdopterin biosynthesis protein [Gemmataceae bacterium]